MKLDEYLKKGDYPKIDIHPEKDIKTEMERFIMHGITRYQIYK